MLGDDGIFITKVIPGGPAEEDATLAVGDRIVQVHCMYTCFCELRYTIVSVWTASLL